MKLHLCTVLVVLLAIPALTHGSSALEDEKSQGKFFLKSFQTTTVTTLSIVVTTVPYFCAITSSATACTGRRLRRRRRVSLPEMDDERTVGLEKSTGDLEAEHDPAGGKENGKLFFTLWQSTTTTVTVTSTATNRSITISASAYCTFANYNVPLC